MSQLYEEIYKLKNVLRKGWLIRNVAEKKTGRVESDAEHTFSMTLLALEIMSKKPRFSKLNQLKVLKMIAYHELCEIDAGDHTPFDNITKEEKYKQEFACVKRLASECDMPEILELWLEYEDGKSPEAQFVQQMDRLDAVMQSKIYSDMNNDDNKLFDEFYQHAKTQIQDFEDFI